MSQDKAFRTTARLYKGQDSSVGEPPSAVMCFPRVEVVTPEVKTARAKAPHSGVLVISR